MAGGLFAVVAAMVGLSFASVPLYQMFCQVTGFAGTPNTENVTGGQTVSDVVVSVRFDANVNSKLPWRFEPVKRTMDVRVGEEVLAYFRAVNLSDRPLTGTATFNVAPFKAAPYFSKLECFCFTEQTLNPGEEAMMPVLFYVDTAMLDDIDAADVRNITLSYTFFPVDDGPGDSESRRISRLDQSNES